MGNLDDEFIKILLALHDADEWSRPGGLGVWLTGSPSEYFATLYEKGLLERREHTSGVRFLRVKHKNSYEFKLSREGAELVEKLLKQATQRKLDAGRSHL
ncbi:hypothetical protein ACP0H3_26480 [Pseudomonas aeruginosa]